MIGVATEAALVNDDWRDVEYQTQYPDRIFFSIYDHLSYHYNSKIAVFVEEIKFNRINFSNI